MAISEDEGSIVIESVRVDGRKFRPSDWIERIATTMATFNADRRLRYSRHVRPCMVNGEKCLVVARMLERHDPEAYYFIVKFVEDNNLRVQSGCLRREAEEPMEQRSSSAA